MLYTPNASLHLRVFHIFTQDFLFAKMTKIMQKHLSITYIILLECEASIFVMTSVWKLTLILYFLPHFCKFLHQNLAKNLQKKNIVQEDLNKHLDWEAPKCWLKYTAINANNFIWNKE